MPSLKQAAADAVGKLAKYLKHDALGTTMLTAVKQYLISLRQINGALREARDDATARREAATATVAPLTVEIAALKEALLASKDTIAQLNSDKARLLREKMALEDDAPVVGTTISDFDDTAGYHNLSKKVRKRLSVIPARAGYAKPRECSVIHLVDIVHGYNNNDDYTTLGMFVTLMALSNIPVAVTIEVRERARNPHVDNPLQRGNFIRWLGDWVHFTVAERNMMRRKYL